MVTVIRKDTVVPIIFHTHPLSLGYVDLDQIPSDGVNAMVITFFPFYMGRKSLTVTPQGQWLCFASIPPEAFADMTSLRIFAEQIANGFVVSNVQVVDLRDENDILSCQSSVKNA